MTEIENIGGIEISDVIAFQTKILMGVQYGRLIQARQNQSKQDVVIACLRVGWNDAFRHTSQNTKNAAVLFDEYRKSHKETFDDYICAEILKNPILINSFYDFAKAEDTKNKIKIIKDNFIKLQNLFKNVKMISGDRKLCFGHFQKMFNMALKIYLCLYMCRKYLELDDLFDEEIIKNLENADCPLDSVILGELGQKEIKFRNYKWSKLGTEKYPTENYEKAQQAIADKTKGKSNLYFDFKTWNR